MARAMLGSVDSIPYMLSHECELAETPASERRGQNEEINPSGEDQFKILAYPNPSKDAITIEIFGSETGKFDLFVYSVLGQVVHNQLLQSGTQVVNLNHVGPGIYHVAVIKNGVVVHSYNQVLTR
jgi:hypothetical protein